MDRRDLARFLAAGRARLVARHLSAANARRILALSLEKRGAGRVTAARKARAIELVAHGTRVHKRDVTGR